MTRSLLLFVLLVVPAAVNAKDWELIRKQGMMQLVYIEKAKERSGETYRDAIRTLCEPGRYCYLHFWSDRAKVPISMPMSIDEADAEVAGFTRNPMTHYEKFLWNCRLVDDHSRCFK